MAGSNEAVVYRGLNNARSECDWLLSRSNPFNREGYKNTNNWHGHIGKAPYPAEILNGQWGGFLHIHTSLLAMAGSNEAVVYRGLNNARSECDWLLSRSNPFNREGYKNTAYTEVRKAGHFDTSWDEISKDLDKVQENIKHTSNGRVSIM
ncbi:hypothetical protein C1H46_030180 [Malus baccata]|uniref:Uncharacterized protein n=1 Tax=Malus baccata TaxID=106549 RepID=A0A540LD19_MALBA|nr:hypothetical protein C1H46_030180 [Malus baccata]